MDRIGEARVVLDYSETVDRRHNHARHVSLGKLGLHVVLARVAVHHGKIFQNYPMVPGICLDGLDHVGKESP